MNTRDAVSLIAEAIVERGGTWADIGAGEGTFTRALVELLGPDARVYAVDRDARALAAIDHWPDGVRQHVVQVVADFAQPLTLPRLDGILIANALHFVRDAASVLAGLVAFLNPGGRVVFIEYDRRGPSRWVPYPISADALPALCASSGLSAPTIVARRPSEYSGELYVACAERLAEIATR